MTPSPLLLSFVFALLHSFFLIFFFKGKPWQLSQLVKKHFSREVTTRSAFLGCESLLFFISYIVAVDFFFFLV